MTSYFDLLPDKLVDRIFSYNLSPTNREAVRLSLLSKRFFKLLHNRPVLISARGMVKNDFFTCYNYIEELRYLCSTLKRYQDENIHLDSFIFTFGTMFYDQIHVIDKCIELAAKTNITNLQISCPEYPKRYVLPKSVFGVESLMQLSLRNCCLKPAEDMIIAWPNLRELFLYSVNVSSETALENLFKGCPLVETVDIHCCFMDKLECSFKVSNLPNLKNLHVGLGGLGYNTVEVLASAAANLEYIKCRSSPFSRDISSSLNLGKHEYPKLKTLHLSSTEVDGNLINDLAGKFPRLEYFKISRPSSGVLRINLSSPMHVCGLRRFLKGGMF